jgi:phage shock protein C
VRRNLDAMNTTDMNPTDTRTAAERPRLRRSLRDRMMTGTAAGIADYLNVDPTLVRVGFAVLAVMGPGVPLYLAALFLIPEEGSDESLATTMINSIQTKGEQR